MDKDDKKSESEIKNETVTKKKSSKKTTKKKVAKKKTTAKKITKKTTPVKTTPVKTTPVKNAPVKKKSGVKKPIKLKEDSPELDSFASHASSEADKPQPETSVTTEDKPTGNLQNEKNTANSTAEVVKKESQPEVKPAVTATAKTSTDKKTESQTDSYTATSQSNESNGLVNFIVSIILICGISLYIWSINPDIIDELEQAAELIAAGKFDEIAAQSRPARSVDQKRIETTEVLTGSQDEKTEIVSESIQAVTKEPTVTVQEPELTPVTDVVVPKTAEKPVSEINPETSKAALAEEIDKQDKSYKNKELVGSSNVNSKDEAGAFPPPPTPVFLEQVQANTRKMPVPAEQMQMIKETFAPELLK